MLNLKQFKYCYWSNKLGFLFKAKTPMKRVRIGKASPSQKAVMAEPAKGKEAFQMNEGGKGAVWVGTKTT